MSGVFMRNELSWKRMGLTGILCLVFICMASQPLSAANVVGLNEPSSMDTMWIDVATEWEISIENDALLTGMSLGFQIWSPDGAFWYWSDVGGYGGFVTVVPGSRMDPPEQVWDATGLVVWPHDIDGMGRDTVMVSGQATNNGLPPGSFQHMLSFHFTPQSPDPYMIYTICIDSCFVPPSGDFVFVDAGGSFNPMTSWYPGGICWPVHVLSCCCVEWDWGNPSAMTVDHCGSNSVTLSATDVEQDLIAFRLNSSNGSGAAHVIDHGDGTCDVGYTPAPVDVGQAISIVVDVRDNQHDWGTCDTWTLGVTVTNDSPVLDSGFYYKWGATNNPIVKDDIFASDNDACDNPEFSIVSGPGEIDPATGVYFWMPGPSDIGEFIVSIELTDGIEIIPGSFQVNVLDENCCPGDVNFTGAVNVGDAVSLINYIFKGGYTPRVMNWADPNADCEVNVGDVVYLINYVFRSGPAPMLGCVY
jgi:hypothetical protein